MDNFGLNDALSRGLGLYYIVLKIKLVIKHSI